MHKCQKARVSYSITASQQTTQRPSHATQMAISITRLDYKKARRLFASGDCRACSSADCEFCSIWLLGWLYWWFDKWWKLKWILGRFCTKLVKWGHRIRGFCRRFFRWPSPTTGTLALLRGRIIRIFGITLIFSEISAHSIAATSSQWICCGSNTILESLSG